MALCKPPYPGFRRLKRSRMEAPVTLCSYSDINLEYEHLSEWDPENVPNAAVGTREALVACVYCGHALSRQALPAEQPEYAHQRRTLTVTNCTACGWWFATNRLTGPLLDLFVVLALFVAYETIHLDDKGVAPEVRWAAGSLSLSYILFQVWERWMKPVIGRNRLLNTYELCAASVFFLIAAFFPSVGLLTVAVFLSAVCMFLIASPIVLRVRREIRAGNKKNGSGANQTPAAGG